MVCRLCARVLPSFTAAPCLVHAHVETCPAPSCKASLAGLREPPFFIEACCFYFQHMYLQLDSTPPRRWLLLAARYLCHHMHRLSYTQLLHSQLCSQSAQRSKPAVMVLEHCSTSMKRLLSQLSIAWCSRLLATGKRRLFANQEWHAVYKLTSYKYIYPVSAFWPRPGQAGF